MRGRWKRSDRVLEGGQCDTRVQCDQAGDQATRRPGDQAGGVEQMVYCTSWSATFNTPAPGFPQVVAVQHSSPSCLHKLHLVEAGLAMKPVPQWMFKLPQVPWHVYE